MFEAICAAPCRRSRTKDLVWLVYRHTLGRTGGKASGRGWRASGPEIAEALGMTRATANRCRAEALDLGLLSAEDDGTLYVGTARTMDGLPLVSAQICAGNWQDARIRSDPSRRRSDPERRRSDPQTGASDGSKKRRKNKKKRRSDPAEEYGLTVEEFQRFIFDLEDNKISRIQLESYLVANHQAAEEAYDVGDARRRVEHQNREGRILRVWSP